MQKFMTWRNLSVFVFFFAKFVTQIPNNIFVMNIVKTMDAPQEDVKIRDIVFVKGARAPPKNLCSQPMVP